MNISPPRILFVCTGNIFRSMSAEYALRAAARAEAPLHVSSAGLADPPHGVLDRVRDYHAGRNVDVSPHTPRRVTEQLLKQSDLVVAMSTDHRDQIADQFSAEIPLFNEIAYGSSDALPDVHEVIENWRENMDRSVPYVYGVIDHIYNGIPGFIDRMRSFSR